jgi:hypothetical protein
MIKNSLALIACSVFLMVGFGDASAKEPVAGKYHLIFGIGLHDEGSWTPVGQSDGVTFIVEVRSGKDVRTVFKKHKAKENHSPEYFSVDLSPWKDRVVDIRFIADPGPEGNAAYDWGVWIEPRVVEGVLPGKWWMCEDLCKDGGVKVVFDAIDAYGNAVMGVGNESQMRAGAQFNPAAVPVGWNILPWTPAARRA